MTADEMLARSIRDAHAMARGSRRVLDAAIAAIEDEELLTELEHHRLETERHEALLLARLDAIGAEPDRAVMGASPACRDGPVAGAYAAALLEIAVYERLERLAVQAGDLETADVARHNRGDEEATARRLAARRDRPLPAAAPV
jgi:ferritin-like metal-binding protein YciE